MSTTAAALSQLESARQRHEAVETMSAIVPIMDLSPEPYELNGVIPAVVQPTDDGLVATLFDANINTSGETQQEAVSNLRALLMELYEDLRAEEPEKLGPGPRRQLSVLERSLCPCGQEGPDD